MALWYGNQATVKTGTAIGTVSDTEHLGTQVAGASGVTDWSAEMTELTLSGGDMGVDVLNVFGSQLKEESRPDLRTAEFTMTFEDVDIMEDALGSASTVGSTDFSRMNTAETTGNRENRFVFFKLTDGSDTVHILMNNAWFTSPGEVSLAADGSAELTVEASCLLEDFYAEDTI